MSDQSASKTSANNLNARRPLHIGLRHFSAVEFLVVLIVLFLVAPFVEDFELGDAIDAVLMTLVLASGVLAVGGRRRTLVLALALVVPAVIGRWANSFRPDLVPPEIYLGSAMLFVLLIALIFLHYILHAPRVNAEVVCAGVSVYLLLGLLWTLAYILVAKAVPGAFLISAGSGQTMTGSNSLYFSFITLSTVGYGDIVPVSKMARMLAMTEAMTGTLYMAVFISRLVSLYSSQPAGPSGKKD
jgi:Ion channel